MTDARSALGDFAFTTPIRVRWADVDMQQIVFNPNYLVYADVAMTEYMRTLDFPYPDALIPHGADLFAARAEVDFRASAVFDDLLTIGARVARIGRTSLTFRIGIFRAEELLADVRTVYVCAGPEDRRPTPVPQVFRDRVKGFEAAKPDEG